MESKQSLLRCEENLERAEAGGPPLTYCTHCGGPVYSAGDAVKHVHQHIKERVDAKYDALEKK